MSMPATPEDKLQAQETNRTPTRIGELLQCAGLLEPTELQIACDMHKAMPEVQFGKFLVQQGFIIERDLESVLLGQKLLRAKILSVAQFQAAMELSQSRNELLQDTLAELGYATDEDINKVTNTDLAPPVVVNPAAQIPRTRPEKSSATLDKLPRQTLPASQIVDLIDFEPLVPETEPTEILPETSLETSLETALETALETSLETSIETSIESPVIITTPLAPTNPSAEDGIAVPRSRALIISQAVPVWQDQLDWDAPDNLLENTNISASSTQSGANPTNSDAIEPKIISEEIPSQETKPTINLTRALPSWQDQLDWAAPDNETALDQLQPDTTYIVEKNLGETPKQQTNKKLEDDDQEIAYSQSAEQTEASESEEWCETPPERQMETSTQLQSLKIDDMTIKQGNTYKKNKDKKKFKGQGNQ
jgi:hypothetical protein